MSSKLLDIYMSNPENVGSRQILSKYYEYHSFLQVFSHVNQNDLNNSA